MRNIVWYLKKYGQSSFREFPFNETDSLILSQLSYHNIELFLDEYSEVSFLSFLQKHDIKVLAKETFSPKKNEKLLKRLRFCKRYENIKISNLKCSISYDLEKQFMAVTYLLDDFNYIAFRGTDLSILGWKENFNMAYMKETPSQRDAVLYVNKIYSLYHKKIMIGGHSKGGNLALYAALYCEEYIKKDIIKIYNFDGPGFNNNVYLNQEYFIIEDKLVSMSTKIAIIAVLMYYVDNLVFVKSSGFSLLQHDSLNWRVQKNGLLQKTKRNSAQSRWFAKSIRHFFEDTSEIERKRFIDILFTIVEVQPNASVNDFRDHHVSFLLKTYKRYRRLSKEDRRFFRSMLKRIRKSFYYVFKNKIRRKK